MYGLSCLKFTLLHNQWRFSRLWAEIWKVNYSWRYIQRIQAPFSSSNSPKNIRIWERATPYSLRTYILTFMVKNKHISRILNRSFNLLHTISCVNVLYLCDRIESKSSPLVHHSEDITVEINMFVLWKRQTIESAIEEEGEIDTMKFISLFFNNICLFVCLFAFCIINLWASEHSKSSP